MDERLRVFIHRIEFLALHMAISVTFLVFIGAYIYIWLSATPAPITGVYAWFAHTPYWWDLFHGGLILALGATLVDIAGLGYLLRKWTVERRR